MQRVFCCVEQFGRCTDLGAGDFRCVCLEGYMDRLCDRDINECAEFTHTCTPPAAPDYVSTSLCINTPGSYICECNFGYTGDGETTCHDVDDCSYGPERCYAGRCTDLGAGDFRCVCVEGYMDRLCDRDINECAQFTHTCQPEKFENGEVTPGALCVNMPGSFKCSCRAGFVGDVIGIDGCDDVHECGSSPCENGECIDNGQLSYTCACDYGWVNKHCDFDYNECYTGNHDCHPEGKCVNTPGGYCTTAAASPATPATATPARTSTTATRTRATRSTAPARTAAPTSTSATATPASPAWAASRTRSSA